MYRDGLLIGLDVGSIAVKAIVMEPRSDRILWHAYQRHETRQPEVCLDLLGQVEAAFPGLERAEFRVFVTGSGGATVAKYIGGRHVHEVQAVSLAVETICPQAQSVVDLGGHDAKVIVYQTDPKTARRKKIPSMNDKCAGGTGAVIDKIRAKLDIPPGRLCRLQYDGATLHPIAGKCGVFAETDINSLQKQGVSAEELMASLFDSIVQQNLSVLARGHTLRPVVVLLGGPNYFLEGLQQCWRHNIQQIWQERGIEAAEDVRIEELIVVPEYGLYFGAIGAVLSSRVEVEDDRSQGVYLGRERLQWYVDVGRSEERRAAAVGGLVESQTDLRAFLERYAPEAWSPKRFAPGTAVDTFIGLDAGSTSTKAVLLGLDNEVIAKAYQLSKGNPIKDAQEVLAEVHRQLECQGCTINVLGVATTGYAKDILKDVITADLALVETVAHTESGLHYYPHADVICDVGGQDIKVMMLKHGAVKDFKLNTQCSAGNGYYLQATAEALGYRVEEYAEVAFTATAMPDFGYGCAVFMQSDVVDFQRQGWRPNEILAGLAAVLPKNVWLYVCNIPNLARLGKTFVLQGGTQRNLAAVKAQVDYIKTRFKGTGVIPEIIVHRHSDVSGAIGCAFEVRRRHLQEGLQTSFIGFDALESLRWRATRNEETRCAFCKNRCLRTFVDVRVTGPNVVTHAPEDLTQARAKGNGKVRGHADLKALLRPAERRIILASCEKGTVENLADVRALQKEIATLEAANPNLAAVATQELFKPVRVPDVADTPPQARWYSLPGGRRAAARRRALMERRRDIRIGVPRVLGAYSIAPFVMGYFQSLGVPADHIVWSDPTSERLYREGGKRGSVDPCFPSKLGIPHVHNLLYRKHSPEGPLTHLFFPMVGRLPTWLEGTMDSWACPTVTGTPQTAYAAFVKESDVFAEKGIVFKKTFIDLSSPALAARQMWEDWADEIGVTEGESARAVKAGFAALRTYQQTLRGKARSILEELERECRLGIVLLARPYHSDPAIQREICSALQRLGYPILTIESLPVDDDLMERLFGAEVGAREISSPFSIADVWKNSFSENSSRKLWAVKYVARHPNLVALELSSFKCGHDATIYSVVEEIVERAGTPFFYFRDIDENNPIGSIRLRIETLDYFLKRHRARLVAEAAMPGAVRLPSRVTVPEGALPSGNEDDAVAARTVAEQPEDDSEG